MKGIKIFFLSVLLLAIHINSYTQTPAWEWIKTAGGSGDDWNTHLVVDAAGNSFISGTAGNNCVVFGMDTLATGGMFIAKYDLAGNLVWVRGFWIGPTNYLYPMALDHSGNLIISGFFSTSVTFDSITLTCAGAQDIFVTKFSSAGNVLWAKRFGGTGSERVSDVTCDGKNNIYITGSYGNTIQFDTTTLYLYPGALPGSSGNLYIAKLDAEGTVCWARRAGGTVTDVGYALTTDLWDSAILAAYSSSPLVNFGSFNLPNSPIGTNYFMAVLVKYDESGNVIWAEPLRGQYQWRYPLADLTVDLSGNIFCTGGFLGYLVFGLDTLYSSGDQDVCIIKYNASGTNSWARKGTGSQGESGSAVCFNNAGNFYLAGTTRSPSVTFGTSTLINNADYNFFVVKYDTAGNELWATTSGASGTNNQILCWGMGMDSTGDLYLGGNFSHFTGQNLVINNTTLTSQGYQDMFVAKLGMTVEQKEIVSTNYIQVWPDPSGGEFSMNFPVIIEEIQIADSYGQILQKFSTRGLTHMNFSLHRNGLYFLKCISTNQSFTKKVVICKQ